MGLKDNLPEFIANERYTKEILEAIEPEIDNLKARLNQILLECCVSTCSEFGLNKYEADYAIKRDAEFSIDERRRKIINKMLNKKRLTKDELASFVRRNINKKQFYISNFAEDYKFEVMIIDDNYKNKLYEALYYARPAHLIFEIKIVSYERRCGTFCTSGNII